MLKSKAVFTCVFICQKTGGKVLKTRTKNKGFTLIEVLVGIALLGIITISLMPSFVFMMRSSRNEEQRLVAHQLAMSQLEWLKTLDFKEELGLKKDHYQPHGIVEETLFMNEENSSPYVVDHISYDVHTRIYWEKAKSYTGAMVANAMKKVEITVYATNVFTGKKTKAATVASLITFEGEREPTKRYIEAYTFWWDRQKKENAPKKNVSVDLKGPIISTAYSDDQGKAIFGELSPGSYIVDIASWDRGEWMAQPSGVEGQVPNQKYISTQEIEVPDWKKEEAQYPSLDFYIDWPVRLFFPSSYSYPKEAILEIQPTADSFPVPEGTPYNTMQLNIQLQNLSHTNFWWNWHYDYRIHNEEEEYFLSFKEEQEKEWDGSFEAPLDEALQYEVILYGGIQKEGSIVLKRLEEKPVIVMELDASCYVKGWEQAEFQINGGEKALSKETITLYDSPSSFKTAIATDTPAYFIEFINTSEKEESFYKRIRIFLYDSEGTFSFLTEQNNILVLKNPEVLKNRYGTNIAPYRNTVELQWEK